MRVVHLGTGFLPVSPCAGRSVEETIYHLTRHLAPRLAEVGSEVVVVDIRTDSASRGQTGARFCEVRPVPMRGGNLLSYFLKVIWFSLRLLPVLRGFAADDVTVIHAHSQFPAAAALLARRLFRWKVPVIYTAHNPYLLVRASLLNRLRHTLIEGWVLRRVDRVIAQTDTVGAELARRFGIPPERIAQAFAGIDIEAIETFTERHPRQENGHQTVFCPAVINPRKNQMAVIESMPEVVRACPDARFVFAGAVDDRPYFGDIQRVVRERGLSEYVEFCGQLAQDATYQHYRDATAVVFPTLYESQGKVLIEAMAFGLPVVASRIGPIMDVAGLEEGSAILVDPTDTAGMTAAIITTLRDEHTRSMLAARGRKLVSSRFPWSRIARDFLAVYQELIPRQARRYPRSAEPMHVGNKAPRRPWDQRWRLRGYVPFTNWNLVWRNRDRRARSILDIGCGSGRPMRFLNRDGHFFSVGIDAFGPSVKHCQSVNSHSALVAGDARSLPFREKSFDIVLCLQVFEHLEKEEGRQLAAQMERIARRQVLMTTDVGKFVQGKSRDGNSFQEHRHVWSIPELKDLGFQVSGIGLLGWGGETGVSRLFPEPLRWFLGTLLQLVVGPVVYFFPRYSGAALCVRRVGKGRHLAAAKTGNAGQQTLQQSPED